jgi:uncharacterized protein with HEPN domain
MESDQDKGLVWELHQLGARTGDSRELTEEQACAEYGMTPEFFGQAWPAYFGEVEKASPGVQSYFRFMPLKPDPDPVGLVFPRREQHATRPSAVVLRDPWEIYLLDDPAFAPYLDELEVAVAAFNVELTEWARSPGSGYGPILPVTMKAAGERQMLAMRQLVKPILQKTGRKLSSFERVLRPEQYQRLHAQLFHDELLEACRRIGVTVGRGREAFDSVLDVQDATIRRLEIIGQCKKELEISPRWRTLANAPWGDAAQMRDVLAHSFVGINLDVVWQAASEDIPRLMKVLVAESS